MDILLTVRNVDDHLISSYFL